MHRNDIVVAAILATYSPLPEGADLIEIQAFSNLISSDLLSDEGACIAVAQTPVPRCFDFTWLGPRYSNESIFRNATCQDATRLASGIPCREPLVVSEDGTWPDVHYIWQNYAEHASCVLASNDVCAQFTYYFNGQAENSTYMCTRAVDNMGMAITSGCYDQVNGTFRTRACFCRSVAGAIPCNNAVLNSAISWSVFMTVIGVMTVEALRPIGINKLNIFI